MGGLRTRKNTNLKVGALEVRAFLQDMKKSFDYPNLGYLWTALSTICTQAGLQIEGGTAADASNRGGTLGKPVSRLRGSRQEGHRCGGKFAIVKGTNPTNLVRPFILVRSFLRIYI